ITTIMPARRGMGLGLAIVRRFADLLGHEIALDSREGRGPRFRVLAPGAAIVGLRAHRGCEPAPSRDARYATPFDARVVAVVDDDPATIDAMRTLFETWGATVVGGDTVDTLLAAI